MPVPRLLAERTPRSVVPRVAARTADASDADKAVVEQQLAYDSGKVDWHLIDASGSPAAVRAEAEKLLKQEIAIDQSQFSPPTLSIGSPWRDVS
jgi:predicted kinase